MPPRLGKFFVSTSWPYPLSLPSYIFLTLLFFQSRLAPVFLLLSRPIFSIDTRVPSMRSRSKQFLQSIIVCPFFWQSISSPSPFLKPFHFLLSTLFFLYSPPKLYRYFFPPFFLKCPRFRSVRTRLLLYQSFPQLF